MNPATPTPARPHTTPGDSTATRNPGAPPRPTSGRENSGLMIFFIGAAVLALLLVLFFNFLGPEGASRTGVADGPARAPAEQTTGGPGPSGADSQSGANNAGSGATPSGNTLSVPAERSAPQAPESQTPPGREGMGAPAGNLSGVSPTAPTAPISPAR